MRRIDLINSVKKIQSVISDTELLTVFQSAVSSSEKKNNIEVYTESFQRLSNSYSNFNDNDKKVLDIFGLSGIESPKVWAKLFNGEFAQNRDIFIKYYRGITFTKDYLGKVINLLKQDNIIYTQSALHVVIDQAAYDNQEVMSLILPELDNQISQPERLIKALSSINILYNTVLIILESNGEIINSEKSLGIAAIDSGSDKSIDFLGAAQAMTSLKELIITLWDRVVFHREKKLHERIDLITKALPVIEHINNLEKESKIGPEQAEILRRNIFTGSNDFILAGAVLPEFELHSNYNPRHLMAPEPKLISTSENIDNSFRKEETDTSELNGNITSNEDMGDDGLTLEEREVFKRLKAKSRSKE